MAAAEWLKNFYILRHCSEQVFAFNLNFKQFNKRRIDGRPCASISVADTMPFHTITDLLTM